MSTLNKQQPTTNLHQLSTTNPGPPTSKNQPPDTHQATTNNLPTSRKQEKAVNPQEIIDASRAGRSGDATVCRPCWPELFALSRDLWGTHLNSYASAFARMYFAVVVYWRLARVIRPGPIEIISVLFPPFPPYNAPTRAELDSAQVFGAFS